MIAENVLGGFSRKMLKEKEDENEDAQGGEGQGSRRRRRLKEEVEDVSLTDQRQPVLSYWVGPVGSRPPAK